MKKISIITLALLITCSSIFTSCEAIKNTNGTQRGAGIGVAAGALLGAVLGNNIGGGGNGALGAVLGGAIGGVAGGVIGNKMDKQKRQIDQALPGAEVERVGEGIKLVLNENAVRFDTGRSTLTPAARANLDKLVPVFKEYTDTNITIFGYTDNTGAADLNLKLSGDRANAVKTYLASKGLVAERFKISGMGIVDPIASNDTPEGRSKNRRVEFAITANEKMLEDAKKESGSN